MTINAYLSNVQSLVAPPINRKTRNMIRPLLSAKKPRDWSMDRFLEHLESKLPLIATPKIDGLRCQTSASGVPVEGGQSVALTRSLKEIPNRKIFAKLGTLPPGLDGEVVAGNFQETQSRVMGQTGVDFQYYVFDCLIDAPEAHGFVRGQFIYEHGLTARYDGVLEGVRWSYENRIKHLRTMEFPEWVIPLYGTTLETLVELQSYESTCLEEGYEGIMLRRPTSLYKMGRSTINEAILIALKRFEDAEGVVIGFEELYSNQNPAIRSRTGGLERPTYQENMIAMNTLGALHVQGQVGGKLVQFRIGSGFTHDERSSIWANRDRYKNRIVKFRYQAHGVKERPRAPVFLGFREKIDLDVEQQKELL